MANGSSFASLSLDRRAKRGRVGTSGADMPAPSGAIGAVDDPAGMADASAVEPLSASDLDFLAGGSALTPPAHIAAAAAAPAASVLEVDDVRAQPAPVDAQRPKVSHAPGSSFAGLSSLAASRSIPETPQPRTYADPTGGLAALERKGLNSGQERSARKDVHAIKVVTRLVRAIAFRPGSDAMPRVKTEVLVKMLAEVAQASADVALAVAPVDAHRGWVQAMCTEAMAELVAARAENDTIGEPLDIGDAVNAVKSVFESTDTKDMIAGAVAGLMAESGYVEATSESIAADKVRVSIGLASWDLYDNVMSPRLGVEAFRYTYEHSPQDIVALLTEESVRIAREMNIRSSSLDSRTMHLQGSIRRVAALMGAEYVNRTRQIMNWIGADENEQEYERRCAEAKTTLKSVLIPQIVQLARSNFIAIESIAPQLLEESKNAHTNPQREIAS